MLRAVAVLAGSIAAFAVSAKAAVGPGTGSPTYPGNCGDLNNTFNTCVSNALFLPSGYVDDIAAFCASYQGDQAKYYGCLCERATAIVNCYTLSCPSDTVNVGTPSNQKVSYCSAAAQYSSTSSAAAATTAAATTSATVQGSISAPGAAGTTATSSKSGASRGVAGLAGAVLGAAACVAMAL
ncbi:hypothetical protein DFJ73DRAFT_812332 [Zopfochytrium polystomum]|nr:hypothetical protein DFJ73DRAFT_812332 [Zopfochytrium polystomum]